MSELKEKIREWAEKSEMPELYTWDSLPDIPLYMDQIITLLGEQLCLYRRDENDKLLTSTMINNYVKSEVIPHPQHKKYTKEQVSSILVVAMLKSVLSIQDLKTLLSDCPDAGDLYEKFQKTQDDAMAEVGGQLRFALENGDNLKLLALRLAAEAGAKRAAAERILIEIAAENKTKQGKGKKAKS
ncbi:MAG: DUF1836 domain-containing protein [Oscillospiraceae bacterium]